MEKERKSNVYDFMMDENQLKSLLTTLIETKKRLEYENALKTFLDDTHSSGSPHEYNHERIWVHPLTGEKIISPSTNPRFIDIIYSYGDVLERGQVDNESFSKSENSKELVSKRLNKSNLSFSEQPREVCLAVLGVGAHT